MADSTSPLSDPERAMLKFGFARFPDDLGGRLAHFIYSTGAHPVVLSDPPRFHLRCGDGVIEWERPKTKQRVAVPVDPEILPWVSGFIEELTLRSIDRRMTFLLIREFGRSVGIQGLTPRGLRHDFASRCVTARGIIEAREFTGTTTDVLMGYARKRLAQEAARDPRGLF